MSEIPANAPSKCPGVSGPMAGKSSACAGCPNQNICSSSAGKATLEEQEPEFVKSLRVKMKSIRHKVLIFSGKGGVGKSSVSVCLARGLTKRIKKSCRRVDQASGEFAECNSVGILDLDICGPSIPCLTGTLDSKLSLNQASIEPVCITENLMAVSVGYCLESVDQAVVWRGPRKNMMIKELLCKVSWTENAVDDEDETMECVNDELDFLIVDTPPGTSDEHLSLAQYMKAAGCLDYVVIVTTPQEVALCDVRKEIKFCEKVGLKILGIVENMSEFVCPSCHQSSEPFPRSSGGADSLCASILTEDNQSEFPVLGRLPLDPLLARCLDEGRCPFEEAADRSLAEKDGEMPTEGKNLRSHLVESDRIIFAYNELIDNIAARIQELSTKP